jgi:hypothetical protein
MRPKMTPEIAEREGYTIDRHCYPWLAYKGPRFKPEDSQFCYTDREAAMLKALNAIVRDSQDEWSREFALDAAMSAA